MSSAGEDSVLVLGIYWFLPFLGEKEAVLRIAGGKKMGKVGGSMKRFKRNVRMGSEISG